MSPFFCFTGAATRAGRSAPRVALVALALLAAICFCSPATAEEPPAEPAAQGPLAPLAHPSSIGQTFDTPEAAAKALCDAYEKNDDAALEALLGPGNDDLVQDGKDPVVHLHRTALAAAAKEKLSLEKQTDGRVLLVVGPTQYPLPLSLVSKAGKWNIDAEAGRRELLARRIGENEMDAVCICLAYADAQVQYASEDRNGDSVKEYAQRLVSTPGAKDGLYWDSDAAQDPSPAGPGLTPLLQALETENAPRAPHGGYYWRILTAQGPDAPGGSYSYVINGRMIAGFALLAVPAEHRKTGVMSFLVSNQGKVYEKDLGPETLKVAATILTFDPDPSWREVEDDTLRDAAAALAEEDDDSIGAEASDVPAQAGPTSESVVPPSSSPARCPKRP
jgi:hypothetical protein